MPGRQGIRVPAVTPEPRAGLGWTERMASMAWTAPLAVLALPAQLVPPEVTERSARWVSTVRPEKIA